MTEKEVRHCLWLFAIISAAVLFKEKHFTLVVDI
jgi:hypothetical protein